MLLSKMPQIGSNSSGGNGEQDKISGGKEV